MIKDRWIHRLAFILTLLLGQKALAAAPVMDDLSALCERSAVNEAVRRAANLLAPSEIYNAEIRVEEIELANLDNLGAENQLSYLVTVRLNNESRVVYSLKTVTRGARCDLTGGRVYRKRTEL